MINEKLKGFNELEICLYKTQFQIVKLNHDICYGI